MGWTLKYPPSICPCTARDSPSIMQCRVWKADLSIGGMTKCETCSHPFSRTYAIMLRLSHTFDSDLHRRSFNPQCLYPFDKARLDISALGFWQRGQRAFFDVRVFNPFAKSHPKSSTRNLTRLSRAMRMRKSDTATGEILKWSMAPSALSCSHRMEEIVEKPNDFSLN